VLKGEVKGKAQALLDEGKSVPEVAKAVEVLPNTLHKAIRGGRLHQPKKKSSRCWRDEPGGRHQERAK
jgi:transposase-like protein